MPTWEEIKRLAERLEFRFEDDTRSDDADGVTISKFEGNIGWFQDSEVGREEAWKWLNGERAMMEVADRYRK